MKIISKHTGNIICYIVTQETTQHTECTKSIPFLKFYEIYMQRLLCFFPSNIQIPTFLYLAYVLIMQSLIVDMPCLNIKINYTTTLSDIPSPYRNQHYNCPTGLPNQLLRNIQDIFVT